jgi:hypothetical protein
VATRPSSEATPRCRCRQDGRRGHGRSVDEVRDRRERCAWIVFATHPERVGEDDYKLVFACEAKTQAEAEAKVRERVENERRVIAYLASGKGSAAVGRSPLDP